MGLNRRLRNRILMYETCDDSITMLADGCEVMVRRVESTQHGRAFCLQQSMTCR
jgi:hypothetical protein